LRAAISAVPVPEYLLPVTSKEVRINDDDKDAGENTGKYRTRKTTYSGWGAATWPNLYPEDITRLNPGGPNLNPNPNPNMIYDPTEFGVPSEKGKTKVMAPPATSTMAIDGRKFNPDDPLAPRVLLGTTEEWVVCNNSISLFGTFPAIQATIHQCQNVRSQRDQVRRQLCQGFFGRGV
jgi:hypothetical protein